MEKDLQDALEFWFGAPPANDVREFWFESSDALDRDITARFKDTYDRLRARGDAIHADSAEEFLATILVLDQFPRNMFRGTPDAFATDPLACIWAKRAIELGHDMAVPGPHMRIFFYLPLEHSEDLADQERCLHLCEEMGDDNYTHYARAHLEVIAKFGRFPHRNAFLGRPSTAEEEAYLQQPGAGF